ncbi:hypothetical protein Syun_016615 [Stephania yunnanensis]|uniref:Uncharacterized protein n=1 Tax=Stephania yunnanensis TaxID=152371 RepID=A0AAP0J7N4_9MAGN
MSLHQYVFTTASEQAQLSYERIHVVVAQGGGRWCVHFLEVTEEPSLSWRSPPLHAEESSSSRRSPACRGGTQPYRVRWGYGLRASMALGGRQKINEVELCSTQPTFNSKEDVSVDTLTNLEVKDDTQMKDYLIETSEECEVFQIELEIVIALNEGEDGMNIDVNSDKPEKPQIESEEDQLMLLVQPPTLLCTFGKPYKGVKVRDRLQIFYNADTFVMDKPDTIDSFVLENPNELLNLKKGVHASLPKYVDAPFIFDISKGEGIT